ncbi:hypothetical protein [Gracilibacillus saliphilus]|uniref:hypothetical protein n=1 Tax=Gracilibacillus saliphilus TaxID=543890 RepID=UPI001EE16882|nr:hypothetical protein [Gracilibacillus saliphilus]
MKVRKRSIVGMIGAAGIATSISLVLMDKSKRQSLMNKWKNAMQMNESHLPIEEAGDPGKDNLENADMVAEGSQFGVHYYNKVRQ